MTQVFNHSERISINKHFATYIFEESHFEVPTLSLTDTGPDLNRNKTKNKSRFKVEDIPSLTHVVSKRIES